MLRAVVGVLDSERRSVGRVMLGSMVGAVVWLEVVLYGAISIFVVGIGIVAIAGGRFVRILAVVDVDRC